MCSHISQSYIKYIKKRHNIIAMKMRQNDKADKKVTVTSVSVILRHCR
jgi:hypothetical protein